MTKFPLYLITIIIFSTNIVAAGPYNKPIYNKETKSYFELYNPQVKKPGAKIAKYAAIYNMDWRKARAIAASKFYKGVRGRLAVVKSLKTHNFLSENFVAGEPVWIGLRYWCGLNKLQWVTGEIHPLTRFHRWGPRWNVMGGFPTAQSKSINCGERRKGGGFLPVHYWKTKDGFLWNANGWDKAFTSLFIEYPTGKP